MTVLIVCTSPYCLQYSPFPTTPPIASNTLHPLHPSPFPKIPTIPNNPHPQPQPTPTSHPPTARLRPTETFPLPPSPFQAPHNPSSTTRNKTTQRTSRSEKKKESHRPFPPQSVSSQRPFPHNASTHPPHIDRTQRHDTRQVHPTHDITPYIHTHPCKPGHLHTAGYPYKTGKGKSAR